MLQLVNVIQETDLGRVVKIPSGYRVDIKVPGGFIIHDHFGGYETSDRDALMSLEELHEDFIPG